MRRSGLDTLPVYTQSQHLVNKRLDCPVQLPTEQRSGHECLLQHPVAGGLSSRETAAFALRKNKVSGPRLLIHFRV